MSADQLTGLLRLVGGIVSGYLVKQGFDGEMVNWIGAGALALATGLWSWYSNKPGTVITSMT